MRRIIVISLAVILVMAIIWPVSILSADASGVKGEVVVGDNGRAPSFSGNLKLMSDGTITGDWEWLLSKYSLYGSPKKFCCTQWTDLSFPKANMATFSGRFCCTDLCYYNPASCELRFIITPYSSFIKDLPPGVTLPVSGEGDDYLLVYSSDGALIATQQGNYQVNVY